MSGVKQQGLGINDDRTIASVEEFEFEPIKGYPMLQWHGKRPFHSTRFYPAQLKEVHGSEVEGWRNKIYWGDNLQVMSHLLKQYRGQVKLTYIDPPFDSKADYKRPISLRSDRTANDYSGFEEKQYTDIWTNDGYLQFMHERLVLIRELMSASASIYLHCDWHQSHYLRCVMDEIFGQDNFKNDVVWQRFNYRADGNKFGAVHDTILFYSKSPTYVYHKQYLPYKQSYLDSHFRPDASGRLFRLDNLTAPAHGKTGQALYFGEKRIPPPSGTMWRYRQEIITDLWNRNQIVITTDDGVPQVIRYLDEIKGEAIHSIWTDCRSINSQSSERTDYPTQKPEKLLERILLSSSDPGDLVFDCFMGSGTTQAVAMKLGRRFIGADINLGAVQITTKRLLQVVEDLAVTKTNAQTPQQAAIAYEDSASTKGVDSEDDDATVPVEPVVYYTGFEVYNVNYYDVFRNPVQAKDLLLQALEVQPLASGSVFDGTKDGRMIKVMPVNRIATRADLNDLLANIDHKAMERLHQENPYRVVEKITLVCMGHEPDLAAYLKQELHPYKVDVEVVDVLRDRQDLQFKRDSEARVKIMDGELVIEAFYPMNLLQKLSMQKDAVDDWRELVESVMIDWNYDGAVLTPALVDIPERNEMVNGTYKVPDDAGTIRVKITDLLSESWEGTVTYG